MKPSSRPIIVLGVDRSGTSLMGDLIHRWGAYGGDPDELTRGNSANPRGYFENREMQRFLVEHLGRDFWAPGYTERLREKARDPQVREIALGLLRGMDAKADVWFWKEPLLSVMLPFWQEVWEEPVYLITVRNPYECAVSFQQFSLSAAARERVNVIAANLLRWQYFMLSILENTERSRSRKLILYESLVQSPAEQCRELCRFLDEHCGAAGHPDRLERMIAAVDGSLHRNRCEVPFSEVPEATPEQKRLFELLLRKTEGPQAEYDPSDYQMYGGWREYLANLTVFWQFYAQASSILGARPVQLVIGASRWMDALRWKLRTLGQTLRLPGSSRPETPIP
ncbi:MAG TPA: sulfotransferase [Thermoanaerobaculia bacterium]|nr:sulfotransferase [Thermoanaerobaculia bacterium]